MKKLIIITLLAMLATAANLHAQTGNVDSLINVLETQKLTNAEQLDIYKQISELLHKSHLLDKRIFYAEKGLVLAEKAKDQEWICNFSQHIGQAYTGKSSYDTALVFLEKSLAAAIELKNKAWEANGCSDIARVYARQSNPSTALEYYLKALAIYEDIDEKEGILYTLRNIAVTHRTSLDPSRALYYLERASVLAEELNDESQKMQIYYDVAAIHYSKNEHNKAEEYELKALEISRSLGNRVMEATLLEALAMTYVSDSDLKDFKKAMKYANEGLLICDEIEDPYVLCGLLAEAAHIYLVQDRFAEAESAARRAWDIDSTIINMSADLAYTLTTANIGLGNKERTIYWLGKLMTIQDNFIEKTQHIAVAEMEIKYETEKKELRIAALEKEKALQRWLSGAGIIILLLALGILFYRHRLNIQKRKQAEQQIKQLEQEKQLIAAKALLDGENTERQRLARDLHDGLGGMLSVIKINLNNMQTYSVIDGQDVNLFHNAVDMLDQSIGELRRVSHNIMPYALMQNGLKSALEDFCRSIPEAHFNYIGESRRLDSKFEVLIYRCAYELINNAIKHANATSINIQLMIDNGLISLSIHDNGKGFNTETVVAGSGLENIRTRLATYNGKMNIYSSPEIGTEVSIEIEQQ